MNIVQATKQRIINLCDERNITVNKLSTISGITQSTIDNIIQNKVNTPTLQTIRYICDGLNIKLKDFFDDELFDDLDE